MKKRLLILGSGFAAYSCLKKLDNRYYDITVISPRNHFLFTPLLPSTTVGTTEFRSIIEPIRNLKNIRFYQSYCTSLDTNNRKIFCKDTDTENEFELFYDILIIAVGEVTNTFNIPGVNEYAYFLKEVSDARKIRVKITDCFENASLPSLTLEERKKFLRFVVCGGGPTGVEFAAELNDFIEEDAKKKYKDLTKYIELLLIEAGNKILNTFDEKLSKYTLKIFKRDNITVKTNSYITEVTDKYILTNDGSRLEYGLIVWTTGNTVTEFIKYSILPKNKRNKIIVDSKFKVLGFDDIFALGDCSECEPTAYPVTAQVAQQEGKYLGNSLNKFAERKYVKPFSFHDLGMLAYIGNRKALADMPNYKGTGFTAFLFWRSVYFTRLLSIKNKTLVLFDWIKTILFGRDVSNF